jgi:acetylornithine deacetylase/succinyl-diaminopimelate desuccinylase-like protein
MGRIGAAKLIGDPAYSPLERMWARPTLDVHGMPGGFIAEGAKTVIPAEASAKISMRLVPDQRAEEIERLFASAIQAAAPDDVTVTVEVLHGDDPVVVPSDTEQVEQARAALEAVWGRTAVLTRTGGSIPIVGGFTTELGISTVLMGFGLPGDNLHAPNERFRLDQFHRGIEANIEFWCRMGMSGNA